MRESEYDKQQRLISFFVFVENAYFGCLTEGLFSDRFVIIITTSKMVIKDTFYLLYLCMEVYFYILSFLKSSFNPKVDTLLIKIYHQAQFEMIEVFIKYFWNTKL